MKKRLEAWFDGLLEPFNPGGVPTYAFLVRDGKKLLHEECGLGGDPFNIEVTNNISEYEGLIHLLQWLVAHAPDRPVRIRGDSMLIVKQVTGKFRIESERLRPYYARARRLLDELPQAQIEVVPREENQEADALTHNCYEAYLDAHPSVHDLLPLATPNQLKALEKKGIPVYRYMSFQDARRLLWRHHAKYEKGPPERSAD